MHGHTPSLLGLSCGPSGRVSVPSSSSAFPATSLGFTILGEIFACVTIFKSSHRCSHIPFSWMVHAGCVFVASVHLSRT